MTETKKKKAKKTPKKQEKKSLIAKNTVLTIKIDAKTAGAAYDKALKKLAKQVKSSGFRKGKVPAKVAEETLNPQQIVEEALQAVVPELYTEEIKKSGIKPLTYPEFNPISLEKGKEWVIEAYVAQRPEINLKSYKTVVKKAQKEALAELDKQIKELKKKAKKDEKNAQKEPTEEERKNFTLQFIYKSLINGLKPEIQELLVKEEVRYDLENLSHRLKDMNIPFEKFLEHRGMTFEQLSSELAAGALGRLQVSFIVDEIAKSEKIEVEKKDLDAEFAKITDEKVRKQQQSDPRYTDMISQTVVRQKVADYILTIK